MKTHQIYRVFLLAALLQFTTLISSAQVTIYATIKGQKSGDIKGSVTTKGLEGAIECTAFSTEDISPRDAQSGLPTGKRMHKPIIITTQFDAATPLLLNSMYTNQNLTTVIIRFFKPNATGVVTNFATITLTNANISQIDQSVEKSSATAAADKLYNVKISLIYQKIETSLGAAGNTSTVGNTSTAGNTSASDDWTTSGQ